jgi:hypothetical protein
MTVGGSAVRPRFLPASLLAAMAVVAAIAGCKVTVAAPAQPSAPPPAAGQDAASPAPAPASGGHHRLARIADEGRVTYSVHLTSCHARAHGRRPDPTCTPGSVDPAVTQANIGSTICRSGYTETVRPPESQTAHAKFDVAYPAYHIGGAQVSELDHLVSLELGGSNDITNLWPELGSRPNPKDSVENALHRAVCDGRVSLRAAQRAIASNWMTAEARLGLH